MLRNMPAPDEDAHAEGARDRACGALVGLAVADALLIRADLDSGSAGPGDIHPLIWGTTTSMAVALAVSLAECGSFDEADLAGRIAHHHATGEYASPTTVACSPDEAASGGNAEAAALFLANMAPIAIRYWQNPASLLEATGRLMRADDGPARVTAADTVLAQVLADCIAGMPRRTVLLRARYRVPGPANCRVADALSGGSVQAEDKAFEVLSRALNCLHQSGSFEDAMKRAGLIAAHRAAVTVITGQIAGEFYGLSGIPPAWLDGLVWREPLESLALELTTPAGWYPA